MEPSNFKEKLESFVENISIPRESNENLQNQIQETLYFLVQELGMSSGNHLDTKLLIFCRVLWNPLASYLIQKYSRDNLIEILKANENGFGLEELTQAVNAGEE
jgi:hypothetical protein